MLLVADINTLWRKKPFEALGLQVPVLGLAPQDWMTAWKSGRRAETPACQGAYSEFAVVMPPGWASKWPRYAARRLWRKAGKVAQARGTPMSGLVVTSPHYLELVKRAGSQVPCFYYCSDDYSQYAAWGGDVFLKQEAELVRTVRHSFFVSRTLADRAVKMYGVPADRVSVSMNATEERFLRPVSSEQVDLRCREVPALRRPVVGVVGGVNDRLDFDLIARCAALPEVGGVVMVGGIDPALEAEGFKRLQSEPRCVFVGQRSHEELPAWMRAIDVALIPYRDTPLNRACSPMRLFDHLASGQRVVATHFCEQVREFSDHVHVCAAHEDLLGKVAELCIMPASPYESARQKEFAAGHTWNCRSRAIIDTIEQLKR